ncbi:MAG: MFS transporter [Janthinobacterium lividum]
MAETLPTSPPIDHSPQGATPLPSAGAFAPLVHPVFRMLLSMWLVANICMWMNDVAAAWLMTSLTPSSIWVALVQTAATLPVFLFGLPSGALADILDRRLYFITTQFWLAFVAVLLCAAVFAGIMSPGLLLLLTFANGIGLAMRWPVFAAIVPELVPRAHLPSALALNGVAMNGSRIIGPLVAGALIASVGTIHVFLLNAILSLASAFVLMRWQRVHVPNPLGRERLVSAMRVGLQFVAQSARLKAVFLRIFIFFFHSTALLALLPLVARQLGSAGGGAAIYTLLLASMGIGAILAALFLPRMRQAMSRDARVVGGCLVNSASAAVVTLAPNSSVAAIAMLFNGAAWITVANALSVSAQMALPDWVRARGMSMYQMAIMGASATGAGIWGHVATISSVSTSLLIATATGILAILLAQLLAADRSIEEDLTPSRDFKVPVAPAPPPAGHIVVSIEYLIDPARSDEFRGVMRQSRRSRLRQGALSWELLQDVSTPGRFVEQIVDESWTEHLRRFDRVIAADVALRERKFAFHLGDEAPLVSRFVVDAPLRRRQVSKQA